MGNCELGTPTKTLTLALSPKGRGKGTETFRNLHSAFSVAMRKIPLNPPFPKGEAESTQSSVLSTQSCIQSNPPQSPFAKGGHRELLCWSRSVLSTQSFQIALSSLLWITFARFTRRKMCFWLMDRRNAFISALAVHSRLFAFLFFADDHVGISLIHRGDRFAPRRTHRALQGSASHPRG